MGNNCAKPVKIYDQISAFNYSSDQELVDLVTRVMCSQEWQAGENPKNMDNPWEFRESGEFTTLKDEHCGRWFVSHDDGQLLINMEWTSTSGWANFQFTQITKETGKLECVGSGWGFMKSWKLIPNPMSSLKGDPATLTLANGGALVLSKKSLKFWGHTVDYLEKGSTSNAITMFRTKQPHGEFFRLDYMREHGMDCAFGKYSDGTEVNSWHLHRGANQLFMVQNDKTISPTLAPNMFWGWKNGNLRLVRKHDTSKLMFRELQPSNHGIYHIPLTMRNFPGQAITFSGGNKQWPHGQETHLQIGSASDAINVYQDSQGFLLSYDLPFQAFDGYWHHFRDVILFTKHCEYPHQKFIINEDNTISLETHKNQVLGNNGKKVIFVKRGNDRQIIFDHVHKLKNPAQNYEEEKIQENQDFPIVHAPGGDTSDQPTQGYPCETDIKINDMQPGYSMISQNEPNPQD